MPKPRMKKKKSKATSLKKKQNIKKTYSTDKNTLASLYKANKGLDENFDAFYLNYKYWKRFNKLSTTYIDKIKTEAVNGMYYPNYNINGTATGRLSSGFHTTDGKSDLKRCFISRWRDQGGLILSPDFSQIEVRIVASLANERGLLDAYEAGYDIHSSTASAVFDVPMNQVTGDQRQKGKGLNFLTIYGGGADALADELEIDVFEAQKLLDRFFAKYPALKNWVDAQKAFARKNGYVKTPWGRRIPINNLHSSKNFERGEAERRCGNFPVQSSASDCVLYSVRNSYYEMLDNNTRSILIGMVHDSYEIDVYPGELIKILNIFKHCCENVLRQNNVWIKAPIEISMELGNSWGAGCIEFELESLTTNSFVCQGKGLRRDFKALFSQLDSAYNTSHQIISTKDLTDKDFRDEVFIRDTILWDAKLEVKE